MHYGLCENSEWREMMKNNVFKFVKQAAQKKKSESHQQESNLPLFSCPDSSGLNHRFDSLVGGGEIWIFSPELCRFL